MSTKKQPTADLPTKTKTKYVRPSRSKKAIAEREAAKAATQRAGVEWFTNRVAAEGGAVSIGVDIGADANEMLVTFPAGAKPVVPGKTYISFVDSMDTPFDAEPLTAGDFALPSDTVAEDTRQAFLEAETTMAIAALEEGNEPDDPEVVRSLADIDTSAADEFADQVGTSTWDFVADAEEQAFVRLKTAQAVKLEIDNAQRMPPIPTIEFHQQDFIPGFAAFLPGATTPQPDAKAFCVLNVAAFAAAAAASELTAKDMPYVIAETMMHEIIHVLEQWAGVTFSEERVDALIAAYAEKYGAGDGRLETDPGNAMGGTVSDENYDAMVNQYDRIRELEDENRKLERSRDAYLGDFEDTLRKLHLANDECNEVKRDIVSLRRDLQAHRASSRDTADKLATALHDLDRIRAQNQRTCTALDAAYARPPFWARVRAVFVDPNKGAR